MIVYIAGPMTGLPENNRPAFYSAAALIRATGRTALNPATLPDDLPDRAYLPICIAMLEQADAIYLLEGWEKSVGARAERLYARRQGKLEIFERDVKRKTSLLEALQEKARGESNESDL